MNELIAKNAVRLQELHARVHETFKVRPHGPEHHAACAEFHQQYDTLAFPGGSGRAVEKLTQHDGETIEMSIQFLETDPWFFGSGYFKETILRKLKHCPLTKDQKDRLAHLIIRGVEKGHREFRYYARLAGVIHPDYLVEAMKSRLSASDERLRRRAEQVMHVLVSRGVIRNASST